MGNAVHSAWNFLTVWGASIKDVPALGEGLPQWGHGEGVKVNKDIPKTQNF